MDSIYRLKTKKPLISFDKLRTETLLIYMLVPDLIREQLPDFIPMNIGTPVLWYSNRRRGP